MAETGPTRHPGLESPVTKETGPIRALERPECSYLAVAVRLNAFGLAVLFSTYT